MAYDSQVPAGHGYPVRATHWRERAEDVREQSRSPRRAEADPPEQVLQLRDPVVQRAVVEVDCFDVELHTQHGIWAIPIRLTDFPFAQDWQAVSLGDVCGRVNESYGYLWGSGRPSIALRRRVCREEQTVAETLREVAAFQLIPPDQYGSKRMKCRRRRKPVCIPPRPPSAPRSMRVASEEAPDISSEMKTSTRTPPGEIKTDGNLLNFKKHTMRKLVDQTRWATYVVYQEQEEITVHVRGIPCYATTGIMVDHLRRKVPKIFKQHGQTYMFVTPTGGILNAAEEYATDDLPKLWIFIGETQGASIVDIDEDLVHLCKDTVGQRMRNNQIKLLLRGDPNLHSSGQSSKNPTRSSSPLQFEHAARAATRTNNPGEE